MTLIRSVRGFTPQYGNNCWFAETATLIGDLILGDDCTVWYSAVIRGDVNSIRIGNRTNIQDNATIHATFEKAATTIGNDVSIGHNAIVHGCTIEDNVLIGMGAIVMDNAVIKRGAIIAAGAVVLQGTIVEENCIYGGIPAKLVKRAEGENAEMISRIAKNYLKYASWFSESENE